MKVTLEGTRNMYVDGASNSEILPSKWRNFKGEMRKNKAGKIINDDGKRSFTLSLTDDVAQALADIGAKVKVLEARTEEEEPLKFITVKINTDCNYPPTLYFVKGAGKLEEIPVSQYNLLDIAMFENVDLVINMYHADENSKTLYLQKGYFTLKEDPISAKYKNYIPDMSGDDETEEMPWG